jgi:hypothetical protein
MNAARALPLLLAAALSTQAAPPEWDKALQSARKSVAENSGYAAVILLERADPQTVNIQLQVLGTTVKKAYFRARAEGKTVPAFSMESAKGMDSLKGSAMLNEQHLEMDVTLEGEDFHPRLLLRIPRLQEKPEVGVVHVGTITTRK